MAITWIWILEIEMESRKELVLEWTILAQSFYRKCDMSEGCWNPTICALTMIGMLSLGIFLGKIWGQYVALLEGQGRLHKLMDSLHENVEKEGSYRAGNVGSKEEEVDTIYLSRTGARAHTSKTCHGLRDAYFEDIKPFPMCKHCTKTCGKDGKKMTRSGNLY